MQIMESLTRFGVSAEARHLLVARLDGGEGELAGIAAAVRGTPAPLEELPALADLPLLDKVRGGGGGGESYAYRYSHRERHAPPAAAGFPQGAAGEGGHVKGSA